VGDRIGSLEAGKQADLIVLDANRPPLAPLLLRPARNIVPNLVYAETGSNVVLSMVAGRVIYEQGEFTMIDRNAIMQDVKAATSRFTDRVAADPSVDALPIVELSRAGRH